VVLPQVTALVVLGFKNTVKLLILIQSPRLVMMPGAVLMLAIKVALLDNPLGSAVAAN